MSRLEELIQKLCPGGVEYKKLGSIATEIKEKNKNRSITEVRTVTNKSKLVRTSEFFDRDITSEDTSSYKVVREGMFVYNPSRINIGSIAYSIEKEPVILSPMYVVFSVPKALLLNEFLMLYFRSNMGMHQVISRVEPGARFRLPFESLSKIRVPIPPMEIQQEIMRILSNFTELLESLTTEITARKQQYEYYQNKVFIFDSTHKRKISNQIQWRELAEIADIGTGSSNTNEGLKEGQYPFFVRSQEPMRKNEYEFDETAIITAGDGVGVGKVLHFFEGKYALHQRAYRIHINSSEVFPKYCFYYMKAAFLQYIRKNMFHGSVASIRLPMLNKFPVPIPDIKTQKRIVNFLENFDALCCDLNIGLPAEIEARTKQYEYYRDKLLTFKEKQV